eukprot:s5963_g3.t1
MEDPDGAYRMALDSWTPPDWRAGTSSSWLGGISERVVFYRQPCISNLESQFPSIVSPELNQVLVCLRWGSTSLAVISAPGSMELSKSVESQARRIVEFHQAHISDHLLKSCAGAGNEKPFRHTLSNGLDRPRRSRAGSERRGDYLLGDGRGDSGPLDLRGRPVPPPVRLRRPLRAPVEQFECRSAQQIFLGWFLYQCLCGQIFQWAWLVVSGWAAEEAERSFRQRSRDNGTGWRSSGPMEQVDQVVRRRLEQALNGVFRRLLQTSERVAVAAESQANIQRNENLLRGIKCEVWRPTSGDEELRTWREGWLQFSTWLLTNDPSYEKDLEERDVDIAVDSDLMDATMLARSHRLYAVLRSLVKNRPFLIVRAYEKKKEGFEALRALKQETEPREKTRTLALMRKLAAWEFSPHQGLCEQLIKYR